MASIECRCGKTLPCTNCCVDDELILVDPCGVQSPAFYEMVAGPEESMKLDGMQREDYSIGVREFYIKVGEASVNPNRGMQILVSADAYNLTDIWRYGCDVCLTGVRPFFPCTELVTVYDCQPSHYATGGPTRVVLGPVDGYFFYGGRDESVVMDSEVLEREIRFYPVGVIPFQWKTNTYIERINGEKWRIEKVVNLRMTERIPYLELVEDTSCC